LLIYFLKLIYFLIQLGLPNDIPTLPQLLKTHANYSTAMVGKWHLGHSKHSQTPIGKGFDSFTGLYMWDIDAHTKQMFEAPWSDPMFLDWVQEYKHNSSSRHFAEPVHVTEAITRDAMRVMDDHLHYHSSSSSDDSPLFLYVAYTAAHSPLQPLPRHSRRCDHIPHLWRRDYCGLVVGLDEGVKNITDHIRSTLGENTLVILASDNGGSPWFGGMNVPLKGAKVTPFEGGTRVPGFLVDLSSDQRYLGGTMSIGKHAKSNEYYGLMHFSDWLPTLLSFTGVSADQLPTGLDGIDMSKALQSFRANSTDESPRNEILYDMYYPEEFIFNEGLVAYRIGDYKLIDGIVRDSDYYFESSNNYLNHTSASWTTRSFEIMITIGEWIWGTAPFDPLRIAQTHSILQTMQTYNQRMGKEETKRLYNIRDDPTESKNLFGQPEMKEIVATIDKRIEHYRQTRLPPQKAHYFYHLTEVWPETFVAGDCSMNPTIKKDHCFFTHPWVPEVRKEMSFSISLLSF
jgi:arylsulfatase A-like enzyme